MRICIHLWDLQKQIKLFLVVQFMFRFFLNEICILYGIQACQTNFIYHIVIYQARKLFSFKPILLFIFTNKCLTSLRKVAIHFVGVSGITSVWVSTSKTKRTTNLQTDDV